MIRNYTLSNYFVYLFAAFCLVSCEKDEIETVVEETIFPEIKGHQVRAKDLFNDPVIGKKIQSLTTTNLAKSVTVGIQLDTSLISMIETERYKSYTFKVLQDSLEESNVLRNYILTIVDDTTLVQSLVDYRKVDHGRLDLDDIKMRRVYGDDLLPSFAKCGGTNTTWFSYQEYYSYNCGGKTGSGAHGPGDDNCKASGGDRAGYGTVTRWASITTSNDPCGSGTGGGSGGGGGNNGGGTIVIPMNPTDPDQPCLNTSISDGDGGCYDGSEGPDDPIILTDPNTNQVKQILANKQFQNAIQKEIQNRDLKRETGHIYTTNDLSEEVESSTYIIETSEDGYTLVLPANSSTDIMSHVHVNSWEEPAIDPSTGLPAIKTTTVTHMNSLKDTDALFDLISLGTNNVSNSLERQRRSRQKMVLMNSSSGIHLIKYEGQIDGTLENINNFSNTFDFKDEDLKKEYLAAVKGNSIVGFLTFLKLKFDITEVALYQISDDFEITSKTKYDYFGNLITE